MSSGNLSATISVPSSKCWTDSCYGVCLNNVSDYINNSNVAAESCANINMVSSCTFQCNDEYNASTASMCLRTGDWENTTAQCLKQCDTVSNPTNGVLVNCVPPLSSGSTCGITCDSGYSADSTWCSSAKRENFNHFTLSCFNALEHRYSSVYERKFRPKLMSIKLQYILVLSTLERSQRFLH